MIFIGIIALTFSGPSTTAAASNPDQADGPGIITIEQLNMCMWGSTMTPSCFPNSAADLPHADPDWIAAEEATAAAKRQAVITQFSRHNPDVVTVDEACLGDLQKVAAAVGYELSYIDTGGGTDHKPRNCTAGRGIGVNAILAKNITAAGPSGYFQDPGWRSYVCAQVSTSEWPSVRVCNTHLSLKGQEGRQPVECAYLRDQILNPSTGPVLFAGDVNMSGANENCAPSRFHGLKDTEWSAADREANPTDGLQHIYYSANGLWRHSCGWAYTVEHTDHKGFLLEVGTDAPDHDVGSCGVREIRS